MKHITKLEISCFLIAILCFYFNYIYIIGRFPSTRVFDICMAIYFWAFVASQEREENITLNKISKEDANNGLKHPLINSNDIFISFLLIFFKFLVDFHFF